MKNLKYISNFYTHTVTTSTKPATEVQSSHEIPQDNDLTMDLTKVWFRI